MILNVCIVYICLHVHKYMYDIKCLHVIYFLFIIYILGISSTNVVSGKNRKQKIGVKRLHGLRKRIVPYEYFRRQIKLKEIPKKVECVAAKEKYACLQNRMWTIIKSKVKNIINKKEQIE